MKDIKDLTIEEAKEILDFSLKYKEYYNVSLQFKSIVNPDGSINVTFSMQPIIGILYHNGQDNCVLHFNDSKCIYWLYTHDYDITDLLKSNLYLSEMEDDFDVFSFEILQMSKGEEVFKEEVKHRWTLEYVKKRCKELLDKYYYKDYE
jgi:hypothetical protein